MNIYSRHVRIGDLIEEDRKDESLEWALVSSGSLFRGAHGRSRISIRDQYGDRILQYKIKVVASARLMCA